jgi:ribonuclease-3
MTKTRALVVRETTLALLAKDLGTGDLLLLGKGEEATGGRDKPSNLANAVEAIFGAIYLDAGFEKACQVIRTLLEEPLRLALAGDLVYDYKSRLLELVQATRGGSTLRFQILDESGPVHERLFTAGVLVDEQLVSTGTGCSKKEAEQQAAREALDKLDCDRSGCTTLE